MSDIMALLSFRVVEKSTFPEVFHNVPLQHHNFIDDIENFNVKFCVQFEFHRLSGDIQPLSIPSTPISSHYVSCAHFFRDGTSFLRSNLYHPLFTDEALDDLIPMIMSDAELLFGFQTCGRSYVGECPVVYSMAVEVFVEIPETEEIAREIRLAWEFEQQIQMIPASEEAIRLLKVQEYVHNCENQCCCCICLEDLRDSKQVATMPCRHVFHNDCIVEWLKKSHVCPLCRYSMSTDLDI
ncbi:E3 ubiquitin-protein ligase RING1-like [Senna tora]|uniref:RING-type E3 ubiquitin transferase n=1 Tax=Senna tora TaxID=362788 RepID=A0A834X158_9FABA|nr:E3 ubiquitin-protein ligase RING1-like [Senna tora]